MNNNISRRRLMKLSAMGASALVVSTGLTACSDDDDSDPAVAVEFTHGVASGDPLTGSVILWTRVAPVEDAKIRVFFELATDEAFTNITHNGVTTTSAARDYTVKVDAKNLTPGQQYYYRFVANGEVSPMGRTTTTPTGDVSGLRMAVMSCSNYPAGYFHAYAHASQLSGANDIDVVLHLGDYIYEYGADGYATDRAEALDRVPQPAYEIVSLADYRTRYAQYRSDTDLQALHAKAPFICVWDDHEITNDTWRTGAENHNDGEGSFEDRKLAALQAYFEWLPIRPQTADEFSDTIYRTLSFGNLVDLHMLDTRLVGRDQQLSFSQFTNAETGAFDMQSFASALNSPNRTLLGVDQRQWLTGQISNSTARWQVLGQQVLMGRMLLPAAIATQQMSITQFAELGALATLAYRKNQKDPTLTEGELAYLAANQDRLTPEAMALLQLPNMPYNLDAWDGYPYERDLVLNEIADTASAVVVLAGDTHNAWANNLTDTNGNPVAVEFATAGVTSPGLESYLGFAPEEAPATEQGIVGLVSDLHYLNARDRGYMVVSFEHDDVTCEWHYVSDITNKVFSLQEDRGKTMEVSHDVPFFKSTPA
ncbi:Phospholipase D [BD1-7 clade bacterium]|uniref:Phospholipase D n=1 Tax=BD1-7 clade bacterium TaxID=2029982 RepID=A0A5S9PJT8_9GAMM|nr:Phospholipase D [BD1-7 clade bacterium]